MDDHIVETTYPLTFREDVAKKLGERIQQQRSVEFIGMKRVGINNFLRFFLFHEGILKQYLPKDGRHFFIFVDLNDLIERELFPFWRLTFKRIVDAIEASSFKEEIKKKISDLFLISIQSGDLFLTYDGVKKTLNLLSRENIYPTLFFTRFDRLINAATPEFFNNLQALKDASLGKLSYIFTSYRELDALMPDVFNRKDFSLFSKAMYIRPTDEKDSRVILDSLKAHYKISPSEKIEGNIVKLSGGHVQYLQLSLLALSETKQKIDTESLKNMLLSDERIALQSEELWESLTEKEKEVLLKVLSKAKITEEDRKSAKYLWDTGFVKEEKNKINIFSELLQDYLGKLEKKEKDSNGVEFSKKEHMLFKFLEENPDEICEREDIVDTVWPEYKEYGVSDWSVDRLVARVRGKLKKQNSKYEIITIRTRGYKLVTK